ncbi:MAG: TIGR01777 family oxidoreductase [Myxococcales bacterium]|nr:TIGR01777 family oxidoreductase [Myxococcales bacterium]
MSQAAGGRTLVVAGASGIVGRVLIAHALERGWIVRVLSRSERPSRARVQARVWDPAAAAGGSSEAIASIADALDGADVLCNLAGASIAEGRLNTAHRERVLQSRLEATRALVRGARRAGAPPKVWLQASAVGYYGDTAEEAIDESAPPAPGFFLSDVCARWEEAASEIVQGDAPRLVILRIGLVLAKDAPAWTKMIAPIRFGLGGKLGSGRQIYSWIHADDLARAALWLADEERARGPYNLTSPEPIRQRELVRAVARRMGRPAFVPAPRLLLRAVLGDVADQLLLPSCKALPRRLEALGFRFESPRFEPLLDRLL